MVISALSLGGGGGVGGWGKPKTSGTLSGQLQPFQSSCKDCNFCVQADKYNVPRICFVNKMDRMGADFFNTVKMIISNLAATPAVTQVRLRQLSSMTAASSIVQLVLHALQIVVSQAATLRRIHDTVTSSVSVIVQNTVCSFA